MTRLTTLGLITAAACIVLAQAGRDGYLHLDHLGLPLFFTLAFVVWLTVLKRMPQVGINDEVLLSSLIVVCGIGISALSRLDANLAQRQMLWLVIGLVGFVIVSRYSIWPLVVKLKFAWAALAFILLVVTALWGVEIGGARSWVRFGFQFQPVEFVKILLVLFLAAQLSSTKNIGGTRRDYVIPVLLVTALFTFVLVVQKDLGAALILFALSIAMLFASTGAIRYLVVGTVSALVAASLAATFFDHVRIRFMVWLDPWTMADGAGWQVIQALFALGAGGLLGTGWGQGLAGQIPVVETDFIFALVTEELGMMGAAAVLFLLAVLCIRTIRPALDTGRHSVERLGAAGLSLLFALQSGLIVAGVTRLLPVTGVTLPFVSYGGSSLIASLIQLGLAYGIIARMPSTADAVSGVREVGVTWTGR